RHRHTRSGTARITGILSRTQRLFAMRKTKEETALVEYVVDTLDWIAVRCGLPAPHRAPRALRAAVRRLGSEDLPSRLVAEATLRADHHQAAPLLRQAA